MNKQHKKGLKKTLILSTLALALIIPTGAGAASAASLPTNGNMSIAQVQQLFGIDLNTMLQQIMQGNYPVTSFTGTGFYGSGQVAQPTTPTPVVPSTPSQPRKPKPVVPSQPSTPAPSQPSQPSQGSGNTGTGTDTSTSSFAAQVVTLVNQERAKAGLGALNSSNATLTNVALAKAKDMYDKGYFDHNSPTYGSPFDMMKQFGVTFSYAGENIAKGQPTPQEVMTAWMNSSGHRANILNTHYTTIGVAYYKGVWVQEFIS
jgi:uncharacterized YkwD family protein